MEHIRLLFKLLFEILDGNPKLYLTEWSINDNTIEIIVTRKNKIGHSQLSGDVDLNAENPDEEVMDFINAVKESFELE